MSKIIIIGKTIENKKFRPSSWSDMIASHGSMFGLDKRLKYSTYLMPCRLQDERVPALIMDERLNDVDPLLYEYVIDFAHKNKLVILDEK